MPSLDKSKLYKILSLVEKPGRYIGGEYGSIVGKKDVHLNVVISYPDLYEIGMSNLSVKILYSLMNSIEGVSCERVFAPAPDMERELIREKLPLFSIENQKPLKDFDIIGFSVGYELTLTNILNILQLGGINPLKERREKNSPIVIAGGPGLMNPIPFSPFIDFFFLGEAEDWITSLFPELVKLKKNGADRKILREKILESKNIWAPEKPKRITKGFWRNFSDSKDNIIVPVPNIKTVQDHGVVEIMRGCPNICRFCSATIFYRPYRQKSFSNVLREVEKNIFQFGYNEITLSSLSSGDYENILELIKLLNKRFKNIGVSFSFPSLRIDSLSIELFNEISTVRKSGLTFAVETPLREWQEAINKRIDFEKIVEILKKAKANGWKLAKFYFMIGLPGFSDKEKRLDREVEAISDYLNKLYKLVRININVNIATFVPKANTPFAWVAQIDEESALRAFNEIKKRMKYRAVRIKYHSPFLSFLEGIISRGDERAGLLFYEAFKRGARLDAWEDYLKRNVWKNVIENADWDIRYETYRERTIEEKLPWENINFGTSKKYLLKEYEKAQMGLQTPRCEVDCKAKCGVCSSKIRVVNAIKDVKDTEEIFQYTKHTKQGKLLFSFFKHGRARYLSHLDTMRIFERSLLRSGYFACLTEGFNPKPKIEFASPLSLGMESDEEIATVEICNLDSPENFQERINQVLPDGFGITRVRLLDNKQKSLMSLFWGSVIEVTNTIEDISFDFQELLSNITEKSSGITVLLNKARSVSLTNTEADREKLIVRVKQVPKRGIRFLIGLVDTIVNKDQKIIGPQMFLKRLKTLSKGKDETPISYFDLS